MLSKGVLTFLLSFRGLNSSCRNSIRSTQLQHCSAYCCSLLYFSHLGLDCKLKQKKAKPNFRLAGTLQISYCVIGRMGASQSRPNHASAKWLPEREDHPMSDRDVTAGGEDMGYIGSNHVGERYG